MSDHDDVMNEEELLPAAVPAAWQRALWAGVGSFLAILLLQGLGRELQHPLLLAPFGASCVLLFLAPQSDFARPRNVLLSYGIATLVGFVALWLFADQWWTVAVAVGVTIGFMCLTHTVHPPAGAHPIVIVLGAPAVKVLLPTLAAGLSLLLLSAWVFHRLPGRA
jgi:CBS-domain-containing membrane protein